VSIYNSAYSKKRTKSDPAFRARNVAAATAWAKANPEKRSKIAIRRNQKEKADAPEKVRARGLVNQRVRFARIPKASTLLCVECGGVACHYHHHNGYYFESRYDVVPVCVKCHKKLG